MNLKNLFMLLFILNTVSFIIVAVLVNRYQNSTIELEDAYQMQYKSLILAQELRQSSDDLTRMARTYVITGNPMFEEQFKMVLDIRNGIVPRPKRYNGIFWDFYTLEETKPILDGKKISLRKLMKEANFTQEELNLLITSQNESDDLTNLEHKAMNAVKGIFQDKLGTFSIKGEPDFKLARELMHSDEYHQAKIRIMKPLDEFYKALEQRTKQKVDDARQVVKKQEFYVNVVVLFSIILFLMSFFIILFRIIQPIDLLKRNMLRLSSNDMDIELEKNVYQDEISDMVGSVKIFKDNTQKLIVRENQLKIAMESAKSANKAKSSFLARMSHELRTPLNAILGFSNLLSKSKNINLKEKENLVTIEKSAKHLLHIINEILELSKIEAGKIEIVPTSFNFHEMLKEVESLFLFRTKTKGLDFQIRYDESLPIFIIADKQRIKQILINLLSNALKFTQKGQISLYIYENMNMLFFEVEDSGIGIEKKDIKKIFKPFEQIKKDDYNKNGTGLGLPITKELVTLMGGNIYAKSQKDKGSKFYFSINYSLANSEDIQNIKSKDMVIGLKNEGIEKKVLVVDDIKQNRDLLVQILNYYNIKTLQAKDGFEAIDIYKKEKIDMVFLDILMPKMDGYETLKKLKDINNDIPIVVVSANVFYEDKQKAINSGAKDFLSKPIDEKELLLILEKYLDLPLDYQEGFDEIVDYKLFKVDELKKLIEYASNMDDKNILELIKSPNINENLKLDIKEKLNDFNYHEIIKLSQLAVK